ncbi:hypothetical protein MVEN_02222400 [Mycena venus]|uniref:F-box domain-containing protein n=1 Tax=Mycena venus TaxID=2733690 RepID=A0A8H6X800_9AGAR|nr:hypothetical protein MVEN_02222400 [Mycena venus]
MLKEQTPPSTPPISLIPPEVLFVPVIGPRLSCGPWILGGPWLFGQVCSHWRALSHASPTLWTSITVFATLTQRELILLNTQLARTGAAPLDVHIRFTYISMSSRQFDVFLTTLVSHSARWRALHLQFDANQPPHHTFSALGPGTLPILEKLGFSGNGFYHLEKYDFFEDAPALRRVVLGARGMSSVSRITLPWARLTTYKATYRDAASHFRNLANAANLVDADLDCGEDGPCDDIMLHSTLTLPRLRRLAVSHPELLKRLFAPALQSLYVVGSIEDVPDFLHRSGCTSKLAELTLAECAAPKEEIISLLHQTRGLTKLALDLHSLPTDIVAALRAPECLCPNLGSLLWADFDDELDRKAFADMVLSRCRDSTSVRRLYFVALYAGRRRMKTAGLPLRSFQGLQVLFVNAKIGRSLVAGWRGY